MKRLLVGAIAAAALLVGLIPAACANDPAIHDEFSVVGDVFDCGDAVYTVTSGTVKSVEHVTEAANGNTSITGTSTPQGVVATDGTSTFRIVGAVWFGASFNVNTGTGPQTFTAKLQIIGAGGKADSVNLTFHVSPNGDVNEFDFGSCEF
jgi:hypothetical protein